MSTPEEYRRKAKACLDRVRATHDLDMKASWHDVANSWLRLAEHAEALAAREESWPDGAPASSIASGPAIRPRLA